MGNKHTHIRLAEEKDRQAILDLLNVVFSKNQRSSTIRGGEYWCWKFKSNIFGDPILTLVECDKEIVGVANLWPWELKCRGQVLKALQACDSVIHPNFQGKGLFKSMRAYGLEIARKRGFQLIYNFPNENSLPAYRSLGWDYLGMIPWWIKVLQPINMARGYFGNSQSFATNIDEVFKLDICKLTDMTSDHQRYDKFIHINRIEGFYEWRYKNRPNRQYGMITLEEGYKKMGAIFTLNQNGASREMLLVELIGNPKLSQQFFKKAIKVAKRLNATFLGLMNNDRLDTKQLWKYGFLRKRMKNMVVLPIDLSIETKVLKMQNWALVAGIHDSI